MPPHKLNTFLHPYARRGVSWRLRLPSACSGCRWCTVGCLLALCSGGICRSYRINELPYQTLPNMRLSTIFLPRFGDYPTMMFLAKVNRLEFAFITFSFCLLGYSCVWHRFHHATGKNSSHKYPFDTQTSFNSQKIVSPTSSYTSIPSSTLILVQFSHWHGLLVITP